MSVLTRLIVAILSFLALFQATEFLLCGGANISGGIWSRIGYSSISMLPPLGLHLAFAIAGKKSRILVPAAYATAALFISYFAFSANAISGHTCYANYAVFDTASSVSRLYAAYYYGWLLVGVGACITFARGQEKKNISRALYGLAIGYAAFMVPTATVAMIDQSTIAAIPSIMCGFAVLLAFALVGRVAPETLVERNKSNPLRVRL